MFSKFRNNVGMDKEDTIRKIQKSIDVSYMFYTLHQIRSSSEMLFVQQLFLGATQHSY